MRDNNNIKIGIQLDRYTKKNLLNLIEENKGKYLISGNQHCISYDAEMNIIHDSGLKYAIKFNEKNNKYKLKIIQILLGIQFKHTLHDINIREIKINNKNNFIAKEVSSNPYYLYTD